MIGDNKMKQRTLNIINIIVCTLFILGFITYHLAQGGESSSGPSCKFYMGEIVMTKVDHRKGQVIKVYPRRDGCRYDVRFVNNSLATQKSESWNFSQPSPYTTAYMMEFELARSQ